MSVYFRIFVLFGSIFSSFSSFALPPVTEWSMIDSEDLRIIELGDGIILQNEMSCDVIEIKLQTFPTASTTISRVLGKGSFYFKIERLKQHERALIAWSEFSDQEGNYLDREKYSFNRMSVYATKCPGENKKQFGEHINI